jgi:hypothetical protein
VLGQYGKGVQHEMAFRDDCWIQRDIEIVCGGLIEALERLRKTRESSVRIADVPSEIWSEHHPNAIL